MIKVFLFTKIIVAKMVKLGGMEIKVEKLKREDLDEFWQAFSQVMKKDFPGYSKVVVDYFLTRMYSKHNFDFWLKTGWKIVLAAHAKNAKDVDAKGAEIAGFAVLDKPYGGVCFCRWLGVLPELRKNGIGKRLIEAWINYAENYGCHKVEIASQSESKEFYRKCGLNLEGKRNLSYFGIDQFIFGKVIGEPEDGVMIRD